MHPLYIFEDGDDFAGLEYFNFSRFFKNNHIYRTLDLMGRIIQITPKFQLPWNSVLHTMDNAGKPASQQQDVPDVDTNPFIVNESSRKYIYHVLEPRIGPDEPIHLEDRLIPRIMKLRQNLNLFRQQQKSRFRYLQDLEALPRAVNVLTILNYNPLFRYMVRGVLQDFRLFNMLFATVLNTACKIQGKNQYIQIPLSTTVYPKEMFLRTQKKFDKSSIRREHDFHYLFMMQWLNFVNTTTDLSIFEHLPKEKLDEISLILQVKNSCLIFTIGDIVRLNAGNQAYRKIVNQINALALSGLDDTRDLSEVLNPHAEDNTVSETSDTGDAPEGTQAPRTGEPTSELGDTGAEQQDQEAEKLINELFKSLTSIDSDPERELGDEEAEYHQVAPTQEPKNLDTILDEMSKRVLTGIHPSKPPLKGTVPTSYEEEPEPDLEDPTDHELNSPLGKAETELDAIPGPTMEILRPARPYTAPADVVAQGKQFLQELDDQAEQVILNHPELTARQRDRMRNTVKVYRKLTLGGKTIEEHLTDPTPPQVDTNKLTFLEDHLIDKSMAESTAIDLDSAYMERFYHRDLAAVVSSFHKNGMFLVDAEEKLHSNELNRVKEYKFTYEHVSGKRHSVKFVVPHIDENGCCLVNGVESYMKKQMCNRPICKIAEDKISLASNHNKTVVQRNDARAHNFVFYLKRLLESINGNGEKYVSIEYGTVHLNLPIAYEYTTIAQEFKHLRLRQPNGTKSIYWTFDYHDRFAGLSPELRTQLEELEKQYGLYLGGLEPDRTEAHFLSAHNIVFVVELATKKVVLKSTLLDILVSIYPYSALSSRLSEWVDLKILDRNLPVGFVLSYQFGLKAMLDYMKVKYRVDPVRTRVQRRATDIVIPFKDVTLTIPRYPLAHSLIFSGLLAFNTKAHHMEDLGDKDAYFQMLVDKGLSTNYLKGIATTFALFMDQMTMDTLEQMQEPTNLRDLLIRATEMLCTDHHHEASSMANHRLRSHERINAIIYNEMSRQYATFMTRSATNATFSVNPQAVMQRILQDQAMMGVDNINPIHDIKTKTAFTYTGVGGRTSQAFVVDDRRYPKDGVGVISEATADSGQVAIASSMSMNPTVANVRGLIEHKPLEELEPSQILSVSSLLMPGATQDDKEVTE